MFGLSQGKIRIGHRESDFRTRAGKLLSGRYAAFGVILGKHLRSKVPMERAEYLFLARVIQDEASNGWQLISKERLVQLLKLEKELFHLYKLGFPDLHYLKRNLSRDCTGDYREVDVPDALETSILVAQSHPAGAMLGFDPVARNLLALIEESGSLDDRPFLETMSKYDDTLVALGSRALYKELPHRQESGSIEQFEDQLTASLSIVEKGEWFALSLSSNHEGFSAMLSVKTSPAFFIPLSFRGFTSLATRENWQVLDRAAPCGASEMMLHLPSGGRLFLTKSQADDLSSACERRLLDVSSG